MNLLNESDIVTYLHRHRDFFTRHPALVNEMEVAHPQGGHVISMVERQLIALRDKNAHLEARLSELMGYGAHNTTLAEKLHRLNLALLRADDAAMTVAVILESLRGDYGIAHAHIRWWADAACFVGTPEGRECSLALRMWVAGMERPYAGPTAAHESAAWLDADARSFAYVPLRIDETVGVLMLASDDAARFTPEAATDVLERFGEVVSVALARFAPPPGLLLA